MWDDIKIITYNSSVIHYGVESTHAIYYFDHLSDKVVVVYVELFISPLYHHN